jgi:hypothetical protein
VAIYEDRRAGNAQACSSPGHRRSSGSPSAGRKGRSTSWWRKGQEAYRHYETGRVCCYPAHQPCTYATGETESDNTAAWEIQEAASDLLGIVQLGPTVRVPNALRRELTDKQWLDSRLHSAQGMARHHVRAAMRSSRVALIEHVAGTAEAIRACALPSTAKAQATDDMIAKVLKLADKGLPEVELTCQLPLWLADEDAWRAACVSEAEHTDASGQAP